LLLSQDQKNVTKKFSRLKSVISGNIWLAKKILLTIAFLKLRCGFPAVE